MDPIDPRSTEYEHEHAHEHEVASEERAIHIGLVLTGTPVVIAAIARGTTIGAGDSIGGALLILGLIGLSRGLRRSRRISSKLPKAQAVRR